MSFRKVVALTLYVRQQKRHRCKEHLENIIGTCIFTICEIDHQSSFDA